MGDGVSGKEAGINSLFVGLGNGGVRRITGDYCGRRVLLLV